MRILLFGGSGFVGQNVKKHFDSINIDITPASKKPGTGSHGFSCYKSIS